MLRKDVPHTEQEQARVRLLQLAMRRSFFTILFLCVKAAAQLPVYVHYTIKDGLPSNRLYFLQQEPDGYMWMGTNKGLARFNGSRFRVFSVSDGLPTNDVFGIYSDIAGKTWLMDFKDGLHYLKNDSLHTVYNPGIVTREERILRTTNDKEPMVVSCMEDEQFGWHWYLDHDTLRPNSLFNMVAGKYKNLSILYCDLQRAVILGPDHIRIVQHNSTQTIKLSGEVFRGLRFYLPSRSGMQLYYNKLIFFINANSFFVLDLAHGRAAPLTIDALNTSRVIALKRNGYSLEITTNTGLIVMDTSLRITDSIDLKAFTSKEDICIATRDNAGNIWIASRNNGFYLLPFCYRNIRRIPQSETTGTILKAAHAGNHTYLLNNKNHLLIYDKGQYQRTFILSDKVNPGRIPENSSLLPDKHGGLYIASIKGIWYLDAQGRLRDMAPVFNKSVHWVSGIKTAAYDARDDRYYVAYYGGVFSFHPRYGVDTSGVSGRYNHIAVIDHQRIWLANDNGISQWEKTEANGEIMFKPAGALKELQVENMIPDGKGNVITQIGGKGIVVFGTGRLPYLVAEPTIKLIKLTAEGLWMISDKGIRCLSLVAGKYRVRNSYPNIKRLLYDEIHDFYIDNGEITAMTQNGFLKIPLTPVKDRDTLFTRKPAVSVSYAGHQFHPADGRLEQTWHNTDISFSINSFSASYLGAVQYEYFISGLDHSRHYTAEPLITYPVLPPGTYHVHIRVRANDLAIVSEETVITLLIHPRWWQSIWFRAGIFLLVLTAVILFFAWRVKSKRLRTHYQSSLERKAAQMELAALQSQMNPHFIFNALGAVKSYFRLNRVQEAETMLEDFAQLIRLYLEFSKNQSISLQQEISALQIYTAIEQQRFDYKFSVHFFIRMRAGQESSWQLPPMILQPFVENAINHGLFRKRDKGGRLRLFFLHREAMLTVVIDDNGVGRKVAAEISSRLHKLYPSRGNNLIADRIQVLNGLGIANIKYEIIDKYNRQSEPAGTRVIIHFLKKQL